VPNIFSSLQFVLYACFFGTENDVLDSLPNNTIDKGRWMLEEHKIFMEEYEKYGNNCRLIAKVLNSLTAIGSPDRKLFFELRARVVSPRIFDRLQSLIAR
jgi:hypothetical protein